MVSMRPILLLCVAFPLSGAPDWPTLFRSLVKVEAEKRPKGDTGAGIVISASADSIRVLTAAHVVAGATGLKVYFYSDRAVAYKATVLRNSSDALDLAVIEVLKSNQEGGRALPTGFPQLAVRERNTLQITERTWTVDSGWRIVPNNVAGLDHDFNTQLFEYTRGATTDGFSGGGVFDDDGRLVGVHDEGAAGGQYAVAVKLDAAVEVLGVAGYDTPNLSRAGAAVPASGTGRGNPEPPKQAARVLTTQDWDTLNRSIVKVEVAKKPYPEVGTGIVIRASSDSILILTAAHVVAGATAGKVYFYSDRAVGYTAAIRPQSSFSLDLAVLEVRPLGRALAGNLPRLAMRDRDTLQVGERIWTIDSEWVRISNQVIRLDRDGDKRLFDYTNVSVGDGFSGGPVFDDNGRLVGIHRGGGAGGRYAVAAKLDPAIDALTALGYNTPNLVPAGTELRETRVNAKDGLMYVFIPPGNFIMGCSPGDTECDGNEKPPHAEQIANGFWLGQTEVTQAAWKKVNSVGNPSSFKGDQLPVDNVDWNQANAYCKAIGGRLPTEKEWEYAARAGTTGPRYGAIDAVAWYRDNSGGTTHPAGLKQANAWGLYDVLGNVSEWTSDNYDAANKVLRGGSWFVYTRVVRASIRNYYPLAARYSTNGFRCAED